MKKTFFCLVSSLWIGASAWAALLSDNEAGPNTLAAPSSAQPRRNELFELGRCVDQMFFDIYIALENASVVRFASLNLRAVLESQDDDEVSMLLCRSGEHWENEADESVPMGYKSDLPSSLDDLFKHFTSFVRSHTKYTGTFSRSSLNFNETYESLPTIKLSEIDFIDLGNIQGRSGAVPFCENIYNFTAPKLKKLEIGKTDNIIPYPTFYKGWPHFRRCASKFTFTLDSHCFLTSSAAWSRLGSRINLGFEYDENFSGTANFFTANVYTNLSRVFRKISHGKPLPYSSFLIKHNFIFCPK